MITEIGIAAGDIWQYLDKHGPTKLDVLVKETKKPRELLLMSLGWLAREGHVLLGTENNGYVTSLNRKS